jgi:NADH:ubiquinone oxidoreductase subunit E
MTDTPKKIRVVLCRGEYCNLGRRADAIYAKLQPIITELNGEAYPPRIKLEIANCLSMCGRGPNCVIYPEDREFTALDPASVETLLRDYLEQRLSTAER